MAEQMPQPNLNQPDQPAKPPKSMPEQKTPAKPRHTHTGFWIMGAILAVLVLALVAVAVFLFQGQAETEMATDDLEGQVDQLESDLETETQAREDAEMALMELEESVPPVLYGFRDAETGVSRLVRIDRASGDASVLLESQLTFLEVYAVPRINYDGRVILNTIGEGTDNPGYTLSEYEVGSDDFTQLSLDPALPIRREAVVLSPTEEEIAYLTGEGQVVFANLLSQQTTVAGQIEEGEYFAWNHAQNQLGGPSGYSATWKSSRCVTVSIYEDQLGPEGELLTSKRFKEYREFCVE